MSTFLRQENIHFMKRKFFVKNLMLFSVCIMIPILILGSLSIMLTTNYIQKQVETNNVSTLNQVKESLDNLFIDIESLNISISTNPNFVFTMKKILYDPTKSISMESNIVLNTVNDLLSMKSATNFSIHSIYIYFENDSSKFISSTGRISDIGTFYDRDWFSLYRDFQKTGQVWSAPREIKQYSFENNAKKVVSMFQTLSPLDTHSGGVIIANISVSYVNQMLNSLTVPESQSIFITDKYNTLLFNKDNFLKIRGDILDSILKAENTGDFFNITHNNKFYTISKIQSQRTGLRYVSTIPSDELYRLPKYIIYVTVSLLLLSFLGSIFFAYHVAQKNYSYITNILDTIEAARDGRPLPEALTRSEDVYSFIITNIIRTFLQYDLIKVQLSEKKYQNQTLELQALQSQMNPHFLFNTLGTIYWKAMGLTGKPNAATGLIENLSDILRYSLHKGSVIVPLSEEIHNTESYILIQKVRYQGRFNVVWQVSSDTQDCNVLKLLIQPFIENSLQHGLKDDKTMTIKIKIHRIQKTDLLKIIITDTGDGIEPAKLKEIKGQLDDTDTNSAHIGLFNTHKRILLSCGAGYGISLYSRHHCCTSVNISLPASFMKCEK